MTLRTENIQIVQHLKPGGIESLVLDLCEFSTPEKPVHIVSLEGEKSHALSNWSRLEAYQEHITFLEKPPGFSVGTFVKLANFLKAKNPNQIHTHHIGPMLYGGVAAQMAGVGQWVHTEHDAWHLSNKSHRRIANTCIRLFHPLMVADAALVAAQVKAQLPNVNADVIYNGIDTGRFSPGDQTLARNQLGLPLQRQLIGCAARLHPVKGQHRLLTLLKKFPDHVHAVLAGEGETKPALEALCRRLGVAHRVHFLGNVDDMPSFYRAIDVFCLASDFEGLPLSPLEAQACNIPVVVTDVGGSRETVCPNSGYVVPLDDEAALIKAISKLFMPTDDATPREFVKRHYDVRNMVAQYNTLVSNRWSA
jgi:glycosyltransferase involved in cell wall biosynthesis